MSPVPSNVGCCAPCAGGSGDGGVLGIGVVEVFNGPSAAPLTSNAAPLEYVGSISVTNPSADTSMFVTITGYVNSSLFERAGTGPVDYANASATAIWTGGEGSFGSAMRSLSFEDGEINGTGLDSVVANVSFVLAPGETQERELTVYFDVNSSNAEPYLLTQNGVHKNTLVAIGVPIA